MPQNTHTDSQAGAPSPARRRATARPPYRSHNRLMESGLFIADLLTGHGP